VRPLAERSPAAPLATLAEPNPLLPPSLQRRILLLVRSAALPPATAAAAATPTTPLLVRLSSWLTDPRLHTPSGLLRRKNALSMIYMSLAVMSVANVGPLPPLSPSLPST